MVTKQQVFRLALLALLMVALLGLPIAVGAQAATGLTSPAAGQTVSGKVDVKGNAAGGPNFSKWQLDLLPGGDANKAIFLALGTEPGAFTYVLDTALYPEGAHALRLRDVRADGNYDESLVKFTIANVPAPKPAVPAPAPTGTAPTKAITPTASTPTAAPAAFGFTDPKANASLSGKVNVTGNAGGPNFARWQLDLLPAKDPNAAIFLALGTNPGVFTYTLDSTLYPNGQHALRLRNVRQDSNYDEYATAITVTNKLAAVAPPDPANATYTIEGQPLTLSNGTAEKPAAPGSATKVVTKLSEKQGAGDLNADGKADVAVVLIQDTGGSGTFYYAAALLNNGTPQGQATNSVLLGDRILLQNVSVTNGQMVVDYLDRKSGEPMTAAPSAKVTKTFVVKDGKLLPGPVSEPATEPTTTDTQPD